MKGLPVILYSTSTRSSTELANALTWVVTAAIGKRPRRATLHANTFSAYEFFHFTFFGLNNLWIVIMKKSRKEKLSEIMGQTKARGTGKVGSCLNQFSFLFLCQKAEIW